MKTKPINPVYMPFIIIFLLMSVAGISQTTTTLKQLTGYWSGSLKVQGMDLRLVMNIFAGENDSMMVTFDSPDQGVLDLPTSSVSIDGKEIEVSSSAIGASYAGTLNKATDSINGKWKQGGSSFPLILTRQLKKKELNRPQEPKPPFPYRIEEVTFTNIKEGFDLAGTLTMPEKTGTYPAVILITGSGPQNRDEELLGHKPFLLLADFLTRKGFAVLRYDDRGVGKSKGSMKNATTLDFAVDAEAAFDFLKGHKEIDTARIGFLGHSEGGMIAPVLASEMPEVSFIVLMAGPGQTGEQILMEQSVLIAKAEGADDNTIKAAQKLNKDIYTVLKKISDNTLAGEKISKLLSDFSKKNKQDTSYAHTEEAIAAQVKTLTSPWFRCFLTFNPETYLSKVKCPVLAIGGSLDLQVPAKENLQAIEKSLIFGGNSNYQTEELDGLNHLFQTATTGSPAEYGKIEETIAPAALELIGNWLMNQTKR